MTAPAEIRRWLLPTLSLTFAVLAVYLLFVGPAEVLYSSGTIKDGTVPDRILETAYKPLNDLWCRSDACRWLIDGYIDLWR